MLTALGEMVADPGRATRLLAEAGGIASSLTEENPKAMALIDIAQAVAVTDPDRAERIARPITDKLEKALALSGIAQALVASSL